MIFIIAATGFGLLIVGLWFLLKDLRKSIWSKTRDIFVNPIRDKRGNLGEYAATVTIIIAIAALGLLFSKFANVLLAYLLSSDLVSFGIIARGVFSTKSELQNPFMLSHVISEVMAPCIQYTTIYLIFRAIFAFMSFVNLRYRDSIYSEGSLLYFGFLATVFYLLTDIVFYIQDISVVSLMVNTIYVCVSKLAVLCYFVSVAHIHLLQQEKYKTALTRHVAMSRLETKIIFNPIYAIAVTYFIGLLLSAPFVTGTQFLKSNTVVIIVFFFSGAVYLLIMRVFLKKGYNYAGAIMLEEVNTEELFSITSLFNDKNAKRVIVGFCVLIAVFAMVNPKICFFFIVLISFITILFSIIYMLFYFAGVGVSLAVASRNKDRFSLAILQPAITYISTNLFALAKAVVPMLSFIVFTGIVLTLFPKKYNNENSNYVESVIDQAQAPKYIEAADINGSIPLPYNQFPPALLKYLCLQEDRDFMEQDAWLPNHSNWHGISPAMFYSFGVRGGSNVNMQLMKNVTYSNGCPRDVQRKFVESITSFQLSLQCPQRKIVTQYLNNVGFNGGIGHTGIMAASLYTFAQPVNKLNTLELIYLVTTLKQGTSINTADGEIAYKDAASHEKEIKSALLQKAESWLHHGLISEKEFVSFKTQQLNFVNRAYRIDCSKTTIDFLHEQLNKSALEGNTYQTSVSTANQARIRAAVEEYKVKMRGVIEKDGYHLYSAAIVVDISTGNVLAHYGGDGVSDMAVFGNGSQMGSVIKPLLLLELLDDGHDASSVSLWDGPVKGLYTPNNYNHRYSNQYVSIFEILKHSINAPMVNIRLITEPIPLFKKLENNFTKMGIMKSNLNLDSPEKIGENTVNYPIGSRNMTVFDIAQAYQALFNDGRYKQLTAFTSVYNPILDSVVKNKGDEQQIFSARNSQIIKEALTHTLDEGGTAFSLKSLLPVGRQYYAKTGTTDGCIRGYTVLSDGKILVVAATNYGKIINNRLELNKTIPIPGNAGAKSAGLLAALTYKQICNIFPSK